MELEKISILVLVLGLCTLGYVGFVNDMSSISAIIPDTSFNNTFVKINEEVQRINQSRTTLFTTGVSSIFTFLPTIQSFFGIMNILINSLDVLNQIINDIALTIGIPSYAVITLSAIMLVLFVYAIYRATLGRIKV